MGTAENQPAARPVVRKPVLGAAIGCFVLGAFAWPNLPLFFFCLVVGFIMLVIAAPRSPTLLIMVAMVITGPPVGLLTSIGVGLSQAGDEAATLFGLDWLAGGACVGGAVAALVARLLGARVGYLGGSVTGAALGFLSWEVVAWLYGWGMWSNRRVSPDDLSLLGSFALMCLGLVLGMGIRKLRRS
jgi:hypothetical protein